MQLLALLTVATGAVAVAMPNGGGSKPPAGYGTNSKGWALKQFKNLITFGDSYTDESRLSYFIEHGGEAPPPGTLLPNSSHTASGGVTWPRYVSEYSGASLFNYAVSGAVCSNDIISRNLEAINAPFPDVLNYEVPAFQADAAFPGNASSAPLFADRRADNSVYSMWIGTNDLGNAAFLTDSALGGASLTDYVDCVFAALDGVYETGARHFVLMALAPLELLPQYASPDAGGVASSGYWPDKPANGTAVHEKMREYVATVNAVFAYRVAFEVRLADRYPGAHFALFDTHGLMADVHANPGEYGDAGMDVEGFYLMCPGGCGGPGGGNHHFMWYDELHPSERTDQIIATHFVDVVKGKSKWATYW